MHLAWTFRMMWTPKALMGRGASGMTLAQPLTLLPDAGGADDVPSGRRAGTADFPAFVIRCARSPWRPAWCAFAAALALVLAAGAAQAQSSVTLVSNWNQSTSGTGSSFTADTAQAFTVGWSSTLTSVDLSLQPLAGTKPTFNVSIRSGSENGTNLGTLTAPASVNNGKNTFTASSGIALKAGTTYYVVVDVTANGNTNVRARRTGSNAEDSGAATGWSIGNSRTERSWNTTGSWTTQSASLKVAIKGTTTQGTADGWYVEVPLSPNLRTTPCTHPDAFTIKVDDVPRYPDSSACKPRYVRLRLPRVVQSNPGAPPRGVGPVHPGETVTVSYDKSEAWGLKLQYADGTDVENFTDLAARNVTQWARATRARSTTRAMSMSFDRNLNANSLPPGESFKVQVDGEGEASRDRGLSPGLRGGPARAASSGGAGRTITGTGTVSIDGRKRDGDAG